MKRIIAVLLILILLAAAFFASYTLTLKYWDRLAPYLGEEVAGTVSDAQPSSDAAVTTLPAETTTAEPETLPPAAPVTTVDMPEDDTWSLILLNKSRKISDTYVPELTPALEGSEIRLDARAAEAFLAMYQAAQAEGVELTPVGGYVSTEEQSALYDSKVEELKARGASAAEAAELATESVLPAGCSEDNIGISVSIGVQSDSFAQTDAYRWLREHASEYGFIERYTAEKKAFTQVAARPWYWRFVGVEAASLMKETGACLEEYLQQ